MSVLEQDIVALGSGQAGCEIVPQAGGAVAGFWWNDGDRRIDWLAPADEAAVARGEPGGFACVPLLPWASRIRNGRFHFCGRDVEEDPGETALHGHGWRRAWRVADRSADRMILDYIHEPDAWPWRYRARQTIAVADGALSVALEIENLANELMPAGLGFRALFARTPDAVLALRAHGRWDEAEDGLPAAWSKLPPLSDFSSGRRIAEIGTDHAFTGWDGRAVIAWPELQCRLVVQGQTPILSFATVRAAEQGDTVALELASHCADAINLARAGTADTGVRVLAPGARRSATLTLRPERG